MDFSEMIEHRHEDSPSVTFMPSRRSTPYRKFGLADGMILIAALAATFGLFRAMLTETPPRAAPARSRPLCLFEPVISFFVRSADSEIARWNNVDFSASWTSE